MKSKKILIALLMFFLIMLSACGSDNSPRNLWNEYIKAMNSRDLEAVAEVYIRKERRSTNSSWKKMIPETYFDFDYVKTVIFTPNYRTLIISAPILRLKLMTTINNFMFIFKGTSPNNGHLYRRLNITTG